MTDFESARLIDHLRSKWGDGRRCPMCDHSAWEISSKIFEIREFHDGNLVIGSGPIIPIIPVSCKNCGNTILLNAIIAGFVKASK